MLSKERRWVVDMDLEKFFDRVNHDVLMARVARKVKDERVRKLIRRYLEAGLMEGGVASARTEGTPQGGPLLSNILLTDLDRELAKRRHRFCRYADDCNVYVKSQRTGQRVMAKITAFLERRLKLKVNAAKSAVARPWQRKFLGYSMTWHQNPKLKIAPSSQQRLAEKIRKTLGAARGRNLKQVIEQLTRNCGAGLPTSGSPKSKECWKSSMAGSDTNCGRCCGGNGSVLLHGRRT